VRRIALAQSPAPAAALLVGGTLAVLVLTGGADAPLSRLVRLDLGFLALPVTLCGASLALGRLALSLRGTEFAARVGLRLRNPAPARRVLRLEEALPALHRVLTDLGWTALGLGLLSSVPALPGLVSDHPWAPDIAHLAHYLGAFGSLALWGALVLAPFIAARAVATVRPDAGAIAGLPRAQLAALGGAYALLAPGGALPAAFGLDGLWPLLAFSLAVALSCAAAALRGAMAIRPSLSLARYATEAGWPLALWAGAVLLARAAERASGGPSEAGPGALDPSYLEVLHSLSVAQQLAVLLPFALIHAGRVLRPAVARIVAVPTGYLAFLAAAYVVFSGTGVVATAFAVDVSGMLAALIGAAGLAYVASTLRNLAGIELRWRYARLAIRACRPLGALAAAAAVALVAGAALVHLPAASVVFLERPQTRDLWEGLLPLVAGLYEARYPIAWLSFGVAAMFFLGRGMGGPIATRYRALLSAVSYAVAGCLVWLIASDLSGFGHGFPLVGAIAAAGMCSLALGRLASYAAPSPNPTVADMAGWLMASRLRAFTLGAAAACYVLLLRPVVYEAVSLAALYEYLALLALLLAALMSVVNRLRAVAAANRTAEPGWTGWQHHRQTVDERADPRAALTGALRRRYLDRGDWRPLWVYLVALLYRSETSRDVMAAVCRALRRGAATPLAWTILGRRRRLSARTAALEGALDAAGRALADPARRLARVDEDDVRRLGALYVEDGTDPEPLAVALIVAHCQRGADPREAVDRWSPLLDAPAPLPGWLAPPWSRPSVGPRTARERRDLVDGAIASLFVALPQPGTAPPSGPLATSVAAGSP
jgi:hypothetical protein